jgi:CRP-like cAMP-binding protein
MTPVAAVKKRRKFDLKTFLSTIDGGGTIAAAPKKQIIFAQGDSADSVFHIQRRKVKLTVVATSGKEAIIGILNEGDFFGEGCLTGQPRGRIFDKRKSEKWLLHCARNANKPVPVAFAITTRKRMR